MNKPLIAITMGDPAGIGPEICLRVLANPAVSEFCRPIVFGDARVLNQAADRCGLSPPAQVIESNNLSERLLQDVPTVIHSGQLNLDTFRPGFVSAQTGAASFAYIERAIESAIQGTVAAVVTAPINKEAWHSAGITYPGHTELFADRVDSTRYCMMMTSPAFSCSLVTTHVGYRDVPDMLSTDRILEVIQLTHEALTRICGRKPQLLMLGLNPHAGEGGLFGNREEQRIVAPAVAAASADGIAIEGPIPPDTAFLPWRRQQTDGFICLYHDQGLIPFKALNFDTGVNITLGLPLIRTSVDHGTALDIAWQGKADESSLISAIELAAKLSSP